MDAQSGYYDVGSRTIYPASTSTWSGLTSWDSWTNWAYTTNNTIIWHTQPMSLGLNSTNVNLNITCVSTGQVSYRVYTSNTGAFAGEETETIIANDATNVPSFRAAFIKVVVYATKLTQALNIQEITVTAKTPTANTLYFNDIDSSQLQGTITERKIPVSGIGTILDMKIMPHEVAAYPLDVYVANTATSTYVVPKIISKSASSPSFALVGMDNHVRDAVVDIVLRTLNPCYMSGNNLVSN